MLFSRIACIHNPEVLRVVEVGSTSVEIPGASANEHEGGVSTIEVAFSQEGSRGPMIYESLDVLEKLMAGEESQIQLSPTLLNAMSSLPTEPSLQLTQVHSNTIHVEDIVRHDEGRGKEVEDRASQQMLDMEPLVDDVVQPEVPVEVPQQMLEVQESESLKRARTSEDAGMEKRSKSQQEGGWNVSA